MWNEEKQKALEEWAATRPPAVREKVLAYPPKGQYFMHDTHQVVWIHSYEENLEHGCETCTVSVFAHENLQQFVNLLPDMQEGHRVFGVRFDNLTPCPGPSHSYLCNNCGERYVALDENDPETVDTMEKNFPGLKKEDAIPVCEQCYKIVMASFN